jgi:hypothetical protein
VVAMSATAGVDRAATASARKLKPDILAGLTKATDGRLGGQSVKRKRPVNGGLVAPSPSAKG